MTRMNADRKKNIPSIGFLSFLSAPIRVIRGHNCFSKLLPIEAPASATLATEEAFDSEPNALVEARTLFPDPRKSTGTFSCAARQRWVTRLSDYGTNTGSI